VRHIFVRSFLLVAIATMSIFTIFAAAEHGPVKRFEIKSAHGGTALIVVSGGYGSKGLTKARFFFETNNPEKIQDLLSEKLKYGATKNELRLALESAKTAPVNASSSEGTLVEVTSFLPPVFRRTGHFAEQRPYPIPANGKVSATNSETRNAVMDNSLGVALAVHSGDKGGYATNFDFEELTLPDGWSSDFERRELKKNQGDRRFRLDKNFLVEKFGVDAAGRDLVRAVARIEGPGLYDILYFEALGHAAVYLFDGLVFQLSKLKYGTFDVLRYEDVFADWNRALRLANEMPRPLDGPSYHFHGATTDQQLSSLKGQKDLEVPHINDPHALRLIRRDERRRHLPVMIASECADIVKAAELLTN